jgi:hypothetical protein
MQQSDNTVINKSSGLQAFAALGNFLKVDGWSPQVLENRYTYKIEFNGKNGKGSAYAQIVVELDQFVFYILTPVKVSQELRQTVAEYITRVNYGLRIGNFEMDYEDGEVRYKSCIDFEGETLTDGYIRNTIYPALKTFEQ